jgi:hypothetical protein
MFCEVTNVCVSTVGRVCRKGAYSASVGRIETHCRGGSDETDAADAIFGPRAHTNHPASGTTLTRERDFDPESAEEPLRP